MAKKKQERLRYNYNECYWEDSEGNKVAHPRYRDRPASLDSKIFINAYIDSVREGHSLNEFLRTHQKFSKSEVQAAARKMRKAYEDLTEAAGHKDSFKLLRTRKKKDTNLLGQAVANALRTKGVKKDGQPGMRHVIEQYNLSKVEGEKD